ncbi:hypothetical protein Pcinc_016816 [Petrolisthes cinctipes]|uniref:Uncharacterized protein n=1 Tax=Petrolisthes cinctipes TaxID=88211 RepID=A0AAE1FQC8_PETCI|nr:hypothetical protein Pcinc_016816 [Petrolisthes cinctipes]
MAGHKKDLAGLLHLQMEPQTKRMKMSGDDNDGNDNRNYDGNSGSEGNNVGKGGNYGNEEIDGSDGKICRKDLTVDESESYNRNESGIDERRNRNEVGNNGNDIKEDDGNSSFINPLLNPIILKPSLVNSPVNPSTANPLVIPTSINPSSFVNLSSVSLSLVNPSSSVNLSLVKPYSGNPPIIPFSVNPPCPLLRPNDVHLTPILATEGEGGDDAWPELVQLAALKLKDKRQTAEVIKQFSVSMSNEALCHLKRVRKVAERRREEGEMEEEKGRELEEGKMGEERREGRQLKERGMVEVKRKEMEKEGKELEERKAIEGERQREKQTKQKQKKELKQIRGVIENVASKYNIMNDLTSGGIHGVWKDCFMSHLQPKPNTKLLDVAGETGDMCSGSLDTLAKLEGVLGWDCVRLH